MVETIFIARHGFRLNFLTTVWKSETGLPRDPPLTVYGETQAQELADYLSSLPEGERPTAIFSSPYYRCLQTAKPVAGALGVPIYVEHGLSEWYSPVVPGTGLHPRPASASSLQSYFSDIDDSWSSIWYPSRKGEDIIEVHERANGVLHTLVGQVRRRFSGEHKHILLVSHAATIIALTRELLGDRSLPLRVGCCSLTHVAKRPEVTTKILAGWEAKRLADGGHLKEGASRDWGFEDITIGENGVVEHPGEPGSEHELDHPVGSQVSEPDLIPARM